MTPETGLLVNVLQRVTSIICLLLFASGCSDDATVRQQSEPEVIGHAEALPVMEWYPTPRRRYSPQYSMPGVQAPPAVMSPYSPRYPANTGHRWNPATQPQGYPPVTQTAPPWHQWYVPVQPPVQQAPVPQPYQPYQYQAGQPQYVQRPWGGAQTPNATFNAQPPAAGHWPSSEQTQQQTHPWEVQPWQGGQHWGGQQNDVSPGYSSGYIW